MPMKPQLSVRMPKFERGLFEKYKNYRGVSRTQAWSELVRYAILGLEGFPAATRPAITLAISMAQKDHEESR